MLKMHRLGEGVLINERGWIFGSFQNQRNLGRKGVRTLVWVGVPSVFSWYVTGLISNLYFYIKTSYRIWMFNQILELKIFQFLVTVYSNSKSLWSLNINIVRRLDWGKIGWGWGRVGFYEKFFIQRGC